MDQAAMTTNARDVDSAPVVFVSSTFEDLEEYRQAAKDAAIAAGFHPKMMEFFPASGHPPLDECLAKVRQAHVVVVIVGHRYGWMPPKQIKSVTWLECEEAVERGMEVLAFLVDDDHPWPPKFVEDRARQKRELKRFKEWLNGRGIRASFTTAPDLGAKVERALRDWRERHRTRADAAPAAPTPVADVTRYLDYLREETAWIDIRGLQVGAGRAHRFPIGELYIPLTTSGGTRERDAAAPRKSAPLEEALAHSRLVVVGDPGAGKTTFLCHLAFRASEALRANPNAALPLFIRVADLAEHIRNSRLQPTRARPTTHDAPGWIVDFLNTRNEELNWDLPGTFFRDQLKTGGAVVCLDGLDEAPGTAEREALVRLFEAATKAWRGCRFVVTTRPLAYAGKSILSSFETAHVEPLETEAVENFLRHWSAALFPDSAAGAQRHFSELSGALRAQPDIRRMARNPVMLTTLAVMHWNERRLPEQRADLYESILLWLARAREARPGRVLSDRCLGMLQDLALAMQDHPQGRQVQVERGWAADVLAPQFSQRAVALAFLNEEELDSGVIVSRGSDVRFWHLTFQEFLAARAIAGLPDSAQHQLLLADEKIYRPEWREPALLLAGILRRQGPAKVHGLFSAVLDRLRPDTLLDAARCAGLLGAIVRDLRPLQYQPVDARYGEILEEILAIFDRRSASQIDFAIRLEAAEALGQAGDPRLDEDNWITIEAGEFWMGAQKKDPSQQNFDPEAYDSEAPVHKVQLNSYQIAKYPLTVVEFRRFMEGGGYEDARHWSAGGFGEKPEPDEWTDQILHPNRPVVGVNWYEASAYCRWAGFRLPTEAEWERAARGCDGRKYPWGNEEPDNARANCRGAGPGHPTPVGMYPAGATPDGIFDLAGNVYEWAADWYGPYKKDPTRNPTGAERGASRVLRGGSWYFAEGSLRAANRGFYVPVVGVNDLGFRCAREVVA